jgi:hypothetical protein
LPLFYISTFLGVASNYIFSMFCFVLVIAYYKNMLSILLLMGGRDQSSSKLLILLYLVTLVSVMNGRMLFAHVGFTFLILSFIKWQFGYGGSAVVFFKVLVSLLLCVVSSGTFVFASVYVFLMIFVTMPRRKTVSFIFLLILIVIAVAPLIKIYAMKNLDFFGGGLEGMIMILSHGVGKILLVFTFDELILISITLVPIAIMCLIILSYFKKYRLLLLALFVSITGGFFGISTLSLGLPIVFCLLLIYLFSIKSLFVIR